MRARGADAELEHAGAASSARIRYGNSGEAGVPRMIVDHSG